MTRRGDGGWSLPRPPLVVSVYGGEGSAEVKPWVRNVIRKGLVKALDKTGVCACARARVRVCVFLSKTLVWQ